MSAIQQLITNHLDIWTSAETEKKSGRGRSSGNGDTVYGIKKLRELILELAVRGKLVPQDPKDEPASELLKRIQAEKARLVKEGKIKKEKALPEIGEEERPFDLPTGWEWVRVGRICHDWGQKTPDKNFTYVEVSAVDSSRGVVATPEVLAPENAPSRARKIVKKGTVIYSTIRPYLLNVAVIETDFSPDPIASTAFAIVHPFCSMPARYFLGVFRSPVFVRYVESVQMGIAYPAINDGQFFAGLIPLPPLAEQHRIVAKVDELMALCDQLETQHNNATDAHEKLVSHLLGTLTQSRDATDFNANWQRIAEHFDTLFTTEHSIDTLKQALLQLAVMGKLVPQDPSDEPASELLKRIQAEKAKLIAAGKIKKEKPLPPISDEEKPFEVPIGWQWVRLGDVASVVDPNPSHRMPVYVSKGIPFVSTENFCEGDSIDFSVGKMVSEETLKEQIKKFDIRSGAFAISRIGTIGKTRFLPLSRNYCLSHALCVISPYLDVLNSHYLRLSVTAESVLSHAHSGVKSIGVPDLGVGTIRSMPIPIPMGREQGLVVTKVNELMILCDQLKIRIVDGARLKQKLADALVEQALAV